MTMFMPEGRAPMHAPISLSALGEAMERRRKEMEEYEKEEISREVAQ